MAGFKTLGNDLYTGERSFDFVGKRKLWVLIAALLMIASIAAPFLRGGLELGIEFTGGSEFTVSGSSNPDQALAAPVVQQFSETPARVSVLGDGAVRVQSDVVDGTQTAQLRQQLADTYGVAVDQVAVSTIGPSWGADITRQMSIGLGVFVLLAFILMALYFRTWKMSLAAFLALIHDLVVTMGIYAITGVEITPAAVIGFLTILGYSLYDTVVVFDKIRENSADHTPDGPRTFGEIVNLAINQTLVRSINTSVVALLPVAAILFIGAFIMGAGTLRDISLALFFGILVGALSTIFLAGPLYAWLRSGEARIRRIDRRVREHRGETVEGDEPADDTPSKKPKASAATSRRSADPYAATDTAASGADEAKPWELEGADDDDDDDPDDTDVEAVDADADEPTEAEAAVDEGDDGDTDAVADTDETVDDDASDDEDASDDDDDAEPEPATAASRRGASAPPKGGSRPQPRSSSRGKRSRRRR